MTRSAKTIATASRPDSPEPPDGAEQQFLRLMSHEMRTPLNGVIGMLGLLTRTRLDGAQRAYEEAARQSAEHLLGLVNDLLDYARLEAGKLEFDAAPVDIEGLVRSVAELLSPRAHEKGLELVWSVAPDAIDVMADEGRLRQVLFNLAGNAVKFTESGGARIFEEFGHVDASDATRFGGAGLGLAVVKRLADAMGGKVSVGNRGRGKGSRFRFEASFAAAADVPERGRPLEGLAVGVLSPDDMVRQAAIEQIEASGGKVHPGAPVVLVDHALAAVAGETLAPRPEKGRGIVLLRPSERDLIARYRTAGFHGYLIKPLRRASLAERVLAVANPTTAQIPGLPPPPPADDDRVATIRFAGTRVLLVEDNPVGSLLAATLLRREGCAVETAANGHEAVYALTRARYDMVFMDMRMPGMDGPTATRAIRARGDQTPIVALTANAFAEDRRACLEAGMDDHLVKPLEPESLRRILARWTNRQTRAKVVGE